MNSTDETRGCLSCRQPVVRCLDFGPQPIAHRIPASRHEDEFLHPLIVGACRRCGLLQLVDPMPAELLRPLRPVRYTEPESHLDAVMEQLVRRLPPDRSSRVVGISPKDDSTIERFRKRGFSSARCLDLAADWGASDPAAGMEWLQAEVANRRQPLHARMRRRWDLVIARHVFEHAYDPRRFLEGLANWLAPGGELLIEVPDFSRCLAGLDYAVLWEEHLAYFTAKTLPRALRDAHWEVLQCDGYRYMPEDSLVTLVRPATGERDGPAMATADNQECESIARFSAEFDATRRRWRSLLAREHEAGYRVALLGAGHLGVTFANLIQLADSLDYVLDDDPAKRGRHLPHARLPILGTDTLADPRIRLCLMSVSPDGEERVLRQHRSFVERGGRLMSIFSSSRWAPRWDSST